MKTFSIYTKRAGQSWETMGSILAYSYEEAKKEFAKVIWSDLLNGVHGDNYSHEDEESVKQLAEEGIDVSWFEGEGIYIEKQLFFSLADRNNGIDTFSEDVHTWTIDTTKIS